jgi:hypothetical protein
MEHNPMDVDALLKQEGLKKGRFSLVDEAKMHLRHMAGGCTLVPHYRLANHKVVQVGRICPVCDTLFPMEDH